MRRINFAVMVCASALFIAGSASASPLDQIPMTSIETGEQSCVQQGSFVVAAAEEQAPSGGVEERAVPGGPVTKIPPKTAGAIIEGNKIKALPGYVLQRGAKKNQVIAMRPGGGGGGLGLSAECECSGTDPGTCTLDTSGQDAKCYKGDGTCNSGCKFRTITTGFGGGGIFAE